MGVEERGKGTGLVFQACDGFMFNSSFKENSMIY